MNEARFQADLIREIKERFPGAIVLKNDASYIQGIPDLTILYGNHWATLETKRSFGAAHRPNQDYYVEQMNNMSFSAFVCPENREEVLYAIQQAFGL